MDKLDKHAHTWRANTQHAHINEKMTSDKDLSFAQISLTYIGYMAELYAAKVKHQTVKNTNLG